MKILVVGFGSIGKRHIKNLLELKDMEIIVCTKQTKFGNLKNQCKFIARLDDAIKEKPEAAIVANNTNEHIKTAIQLAKSGIDLFIEKPLSDNSKNVKILLKLVKQNNLITMIGCNLRFHESICTIKKLIDKKIIGRIISVQAESGSYLPDWHPDENYKKTYAARKDLGGGVVLTCIHEIDYLYWFFGNVKNIFSITGQYGNLKITSEDLSAIVMKFQNDIVVELHLDYVQKPPIRRCKLIGTTGQIYWDSDSNVVKLFDFKKNRWIQKSKIKTYDRNTMYQKEILHFVECVKKQKKTINPIEEGIKTMELALSVKNSSKSGRLIKT